MRPSGAELHRGKWRTHNIPPVRKWCTLSNNPLSFQGKRIFHINKTLVCPGPRSFQSNPPNEPWVSAAIIVCPTPLLIFITPVHAQVIICNINVIQWALFYNSCNRSIGCPWYKVVLVILQLYIFCIRTKGNLLQ